MGDAADDVERRALDESNVTATRDAEVRPEELTQGGGDSVGQSSLAPEVIDELKKPLDPNRVRRRDGRGGQKYEYLAGHDVYRRGNQLFGFGNWGTKIDEMVEIAAVQVTADNGRKGWHVGYRCTVTLTVKGCVPVDGNGFGDGVEYTPAARITACELATKEAETDAIKRAFTKFGDQFGLILYAKADEKKRIDRDENLSQAREAVRVEPSPPKPQTWPEAIQRFEVMVGVDEGTPWLEEMTEARWGAPSLRDLTSADRLVAFQEFASTVMLLEEELAEMGEPLLLEDLRERVSAAFGKRCKGIVLEGPPWALSGPESEAGRPSKEMVLSGFPEAEESPDEPTDDPVILEDPTAETYD